MDDPVIYPDEPVEYLETTGIEFFDKDGKDYWKTKSMDIIRGPFDLFNDCLRDAWNYREGQK